MKSLLRMHAANMNERMTKIHTFIQLSEREENPTHTCTQDTSKNILIGTADTLG